MMNDSSHARRLLRRPHPSAAIVAKGVNILVSCALLLLTTLNSAWAVDPSRHLSQYAHRAWRIEDGFFRSSPSAVTQTKDGYLWIGTTSGLLRFDGVRFVPWSSRNGERLPSSEVLGLKAGSDGSLWIGTAAGLSRWKADRLTNYPAIHDRVFSILEDNRGTVWFSRLTFPRESGPLCQVQDADVRCFGEKDGVPSVTVATALVQDTQGNFWIGGDTALVRWNAGLSTTFRPRRMRALLGQTGVSSLACTKEGDLWIGIEGAGPGLGLQRLVRGRWKPFVSPEVDGSKLTVNALLVDRENVLWIGTADRGLFRIHGDMVEHFDSRDGLSSNSVFAFAEDREGNVWVATSDGLDRFNDTRIVHFSTREGIRTTEVDSVLASHDGSIWAGGTGFLGRLQNGTTFFDFSTKGLPGIQVTSLFEDHAGQLWVGIDNTLSIYKDGKFTRINRPDGRPIGFVVGIAEDTEDNIWVAAFKPPRTLIRIRDRVLQEERTAPEMPAARRVAADPKGGIWLGLMNGHLGHYQDGKLATYQFADDDSAQVYQLLPDADGSVLAATDYGLIGWRNGSLLKLTLRNGLPCDVVHSMTFDNHGNLWLFTECALSEITKTDLQRWWNNPDTKISVRTFDVLDGARTGSVPFVAAAKSTDGRLWFGNGRLLQMIDPDHMVENSIAPPVHIEEIVADRKTYLLGGAPRLAPLTRSIEIDYTALSFAVPQRVQFRYKLEGHDLAWQEAGSRRQAFYNDLRPGKYRFRVVACNNDAVWNEEAATLDFTIAPAWFQTQWFRLLCVTAAAFVVWVIYKMRVGQIARAISTRFDERLAERTRMARELHDTFLQTIQGSKLVADDALEKSSDPALMRRAMEQLSTWLGQATQEGRAALNSLRTSTTETNDLAAALRRATEVGVVPPSMAVTFSITGNAKEMHPIVRDEIYRIGYEAIRNASMHSRASQMEVGVTYTDDLLLRIRDNGIGIDPTISDHGKDGHFGLQGMRERATRINGKLTLVSSPHTGTEVTLVVPGGIIFEGARRPNRTLLDSILDLLRRARRAS